MKILKIIKKKKKEMKVSKRMDLVVKGKAQAAHAVKKKI